METFSKDQDLFGPSNDQLTEIKSPTDSVIDPEFEEDTTGKKTRGQEARYEFYSRFMDKSTYFNKEEDLAIGKKIDTLNEMHQKLFRKIRRLKLKECTSKKQKEQMKELLKFVERVKKPENLNGHKNIVVETALEKNRHKLIDYWDKLEQTKAEICQLKGALVASCLALVIRIAKKYVNRGVDLLDLIQEGNKGLMRAADLYDYSRGYKFTTYAVWWIVQRITRAIYDQSKNIRKPVHVNEFASEVFKTASKLRLKNNGAIKPSIEEIAKDMKVPVQKVLKILDAINTDSVSLDAPIGLDQEKILSDFVPDKQNKSQLKSAENKELEETVDVVLSCLTPKEKDIIELRFGIGKNGEHTLEEIGKKYNRTRERIRQIEAIALRKLRHPQRRKELNVFFSKAS